MAKMKDVIIEEQDTGEKKYFRSTPEQLKSISRIRKEWSQSWQSEHTREQELIRRTNPFD